MDERLEGILCSTVDAEFDRVAAGALGAWSVVRSGPPAMSEIKKPHNDRRTIGIVKVSGTTATPGGRPQAWSAVAKVIDFAVDVGPDVFVEPENEEVVYERCLFADDGLPFRPARCYFVSRPSPQVKVLWLEDLTGADTAPFDVRQLASMAYTLGQWNGFHAPKTPDLPFRIPANSFITRWQKAGFEKWLSELEVSRDHPYTHQIYGDLPIGIAAELLEAMTLLNRRTGSLRQSLAFGDCNIGNLFWNGRETIAVDWASLAADPIGVDAGCAIGSGFTFGKRGADIAIKERDLFDRYVEGLADAGWRGDRDDVRRAYFGQFAIYLMYTALMPVILAVPGKYFPREVQEGRFQTRWEEIPPLLYGTMRLLPAFLAEIRSLT